MPPRTLFFCFTRLLCAAAALLSSVWCLFAWIPFTWQQVIKGNLFPPLTRFAAAAHWLNFIVLILLALQLFPQRRRRSLQVFFAFQLSLAVFCLFFPVLPNLQNAAASLVWALIFLLPLPWLSVLDCLAARPRLVWAPRQSLPDSRAFHAAAFAAPFVALVSAALAWFIDPASASLPSPLWGAAAHFVLFSLAFIALAAAHALASFFARPARLEFLLVLFLLGLLLFSFLFETAFPAVSFQGLPALAFSAAFALALTLLVAALGSTLAASSGQTLTTGLDVLVLPLTAPLGNSPLICWLVLPTLALGAARLIRFIAGFDWNYLGQESATATFWLLVFALFYRLSGFRRTPRRLPIMPAVLGAGAICVTFAAAYSRYAPDQQLQAYAGRNISWRIIRGIVAPATEDAAFYAFLNASSNITRSVTVAPVNIELADRTHPPTARPNIFLFVIDSLRRDYLGAYNPAVTFTPALDAFARENTAVPNAFTRYGGTGLSEPAIWIGGMTLHKQYVTPFYPMNSLAKLVGGADYRQFIGMDSILDTVVPRTPALLPLDQGRLTMDYDLCSTLAELQTRLPNVSGPVFAWTQPQNLHISTLAREGKSVPPGESYPGFYAPYASRLRRIDACFGNFIAALKASGLYDSSAIIVTSDHGDSLGEEGRWGHAYTLFPEILRIPLLVHLPNSAARILDPTPAAVFSTDIVPTLYDLLGYPPKPSPSGMFGRSLFTPPPSSSGYLVAASYAAVYGIVNREGTRAFVSDAVSARDYLFALSPTGPDSALPLQPAETSLYKGKIRKLVEDLNAFYSFRPATP